MGGLARIQVDMAHYWRMWLASYVLGVLYDGRNELMFWLAGPKARLRSEYQSQTNTTLKTTLTHNAVEE